MGLGVFLAESLRSNLFGKLIKMDRQYYMQSLALISVCRKFSAPSIEHSQQRQDLSKVFEAVHKALEAGSSAKDSRSANEEFKEARRRLCEYVGSYGIGQAQDLRQSNNELGKRILDELLQSVRQDHFAMENLDRISKIHQEELDKIQSAAKRTISICYWPEEPFTVDGKTKCHLFDKFVQVEKGTALEVLLLRLLSSRIFSKEYPISLKQRPEFYERLPETSETYDRLAKYSDRFRGQKYKSIRALDPYQTVDNFKGKPIHIILSLREKGPKILKGKGKSLPLPPEWTNAWYLQDDPTSVVCKRKDPYSSLCKYSVRNLEAFRATGVFNGEDSAISFTESESSLTEFESHPVQSYGHCHSSQDQRIEQFVQMPMKMPIPEHFSGSKQDQISDGGELGYHSHISSSSHVNDDTGPAFPEPEFQPYVPEHHATAPDAAALSIPTSIDESITRNSSEAAASDSTLVADDEQLVRANSTVEAERSPQEGSTTTSIASITTQPVPKETGPSSQRGSTISPASITVVQPAPQQHRTRPVDINVLPSRGMSSQKYDVRMKPVEVPKKKGMFARIVDWVTGS